MPDEWGNMDAMNVLKQAAKNADVPLMHIGRKMGVADNYVNKTIARGSTPKCDTMARMLEVCGYGLYAMPLDQAPKDAIQITVNDDSN